MAAFLITRKFGVASEIGLPIYFWGMDSVSRVIRSFGIPAYTKPPLMPV
jgi:hypothetical protein